MTLVQVAVAVGAVVVLLVLAIVAARRFHLGARTVYDGIQAADIHKSFVLGAQARRGTFMTPSLEDTTNTTVIASDPGEKNTTANVLSMHLYNGFISPYVLVSTCEVNPSIQPAKSLANTSPPTAIMPEQALWDPAFSVDFINGIGGTSYAHVMPAGREGGLSPRWSPTLDAREPVVSTRGLRMSTRRLPDGGAQIEDYDRTSNTLRMFGKRRSWGGHVVYADNHMNFEESPAPRDAEVGVRRNGADLRWSDFLFADEYAAGDGPEHPYTTNAYLGIFTKAGPTIADYGAIWD